MLLLLNSLHEIDQQKRNQKKKKVHVAQNRHTPSLVFPYIIPCRYLGCLPKFFFWGKRIARIACVDLAGQQRTEGVIAEL